MSLEKIFYIVAGLFCFACICAIFGGLVYTMNHRCAVGQINTFFEHFLAAAVLMTAAIVVFLCIAGILYCIERIQDK